MNLSKAVRYGVTGTTVMAILAIATVVCIAKQELPWRFNYQVNSNMTISLMRPDVPERKSILLGFIFLPEACHSVDTSHWEPGEWGRISFGQQRLTGWPTCRVERRVAWDAKETAEHYARLEEEFLKQGP